jgi:hypothetical protein
LEPVLPLEIPAGQSRDIPIVVVTIAPGAFGQDVAFYISSRDRLLEHSQFLGGTAAEGVEVAEGTKGGL